MLASLLCFLFAILLSQHRESKMPKSMEAYVYSLLYNTPGYDYDRVNVLILNLLYYHRALQT